MANIYNNSEEWNMNLRWLDYIYMLIMRYGEASLDRDYEIMYRTFKPTRKDNIPKIEKDDTEKNLKTIWENLGKMEQKDENGRVTCYYPQTIRHTEKLMDDTYAMILIKLEEKGLLTKKGKDPSHAMGNFGSS